MERVIKFRPLRRIKKTGKIVVASYMQWRKVMTADYSKFSLNLSDEHKGFPKDEFVYDHKGNLIFFFTYNPADVPVYDSQAEGILDDDWLTRVHESKQPYGIRWRICTPDHVNYHMPGADCSGVPTFTHWTENRVTQEDTWNYYGADSFEPLTVATVRMWFGWFLWQLENASITPAPSAD